MVSCFLFLNNQKTIMTDIWKVRLFKPHPAIATTTPFYIYVSKEFLGLISRTRSYPTPILNSGKVKYLSTIYIVYLGVPICIWKTILFGFYRITVFDIILHYIFQSDHKSLSCNNTYFCSRTTPSARPWSTQPHLRNAPQG